MPGKEPSGRFKCTGCLSLRLPFLACFKETPEGNHPFLGGFPIWRQTPVDTKKIARATVTEFPVGKRASFTGFVEVLRPFSPSKWKKASACFRLSAQGLRAPARVKHGSGWGAGSARALVSKEKRSCEVAERAGRVKQP